MESDQKWIFFNIVPLTVHTLLPLVLQCLETIDEEVFFPLVRKVLNIRQDVINTAIFVPNQLFVCFFLFGEQMIIRLSQIRRMSSLISLLKSTVMHASIETRNLWIGTIS